MVGESISKQLLHTIEFKKLKTYGIITEDLGKYDMPADSERSFSPKRNDGQPDEILVQEIEGMNLN